MFGRKRPEVLVVGAGPVGLFTALALGRQGVRVQIVDKEWRTGTHSYALALHAGSLALLEEMGLLNEALATSHRVRTLAVYDGPERRGEMHFSDLAEDHSFVAVMRQADLERLLEEALKKAGVKVSWNHEVSQLDPQADRVAATVQKLDKESLGYGFQTSTWVVTKTSQLEVPFVIGADGHRSTVRRALGIDFPEVGEAKDFAVFEFETDAQLGDQMWLVLSGDTENVCWPLPGGYCRWSFEIPRDEAVDARKKERTYGQVGHTHFPVLAEDHLRELLRERAPWFESKVVDVRWRMVVRFERRLADAFGRDRVWLAGDAGHLTGPAGVQSMNVGLREARDLAAIVARAVKGEAVEAELQGYDRARRAEWQQLLGLQGGLQASNGADPWVAAHAARLLSCIPASGDDLRRLAGQVGLR